MLSIIIVHYKTPELLKLCLSYINKAVEHDQLSSEIIVVDSQAQGSHADMLAQEFPNVHYIPAKENTGYARGVNIGLRHAKGDYLFISQPDVFMPQRGLKELIYYLMQNPTIGLIGPRLLNFDGSFQQTFFKFYTPWTVLYRRTPLGMLPYSQKKLASFQYYKKQPQKSQEVDWLMGAALMTTKEALKKVGYMDERYFMYFEDVDWARSFWQKGYKVVYYPEVSMYHWLARESHLGWGMFDAVINKQTRIHIASGIKHFLKWGI